jgi:hypothetical protein
LQQFKILLHNLHNHYKCLYRHIICNYPCILWIYLHLYLHRIHLFTQIHRNTFHLLHTNKNQLKCHKLHILVLNIEGNFHRILHITHQYLQNIFMDISLHIYLIFHPKTILKNELYFITTIFTTIFITTFNTIFHAFFQIFILFISIISFQFFITFSIFMV